MRAGQDLKAGMPQRGSTSAEVSTLTERGWAKWKATKIVSARISSVHLALNTADPCGVLTRAIDPSAIPAWSATVGWTSTVGSGRSEARRSTPGVCDPEL